MMDLNLAPFFNIDLKQTVFETNFNTIRFFNAHFQFSLIYPKGTDFVVYVFHPSFEEKKPVNLILGKCHMCFRYY